MSSLLRILAVVLIGVSAVACTLPEGVTVEEARGTDAPNTGRERLRERYGTITGEEGILSTRVARNREEPGGGGGIGVNSYLWRASLDTLAFLPLVDADPFGGVINYDWYAPPESPEERFKITVYITDSRLRADALDVSVLRQIRAGGEWRNEELRAGTDREIEDRILTRARELRIATG